MFKGMINNEADAAFSSTINGQTREVESSPRGIWWARTPHGDKAGWDRIRKVGPFFLPHNATCGSGGLSPNSPAEMPTYPYPIFMSYASAPPDLVYGITKAMITGFDAYKDGAPGADGLALKNQKLQWAVPYHQGAVKALKEAKRLVRCRRGLQQRALQTAGRAGCCVGSLHEGQSAGRFRAVPSGLDGCAQGCAHQGRYGRGLRVSRVAGNSAEGRLPVLRQAPASDKRRSSGSTGG